MGCFFGEYDPVQCQEFWEFAHTDKVREDYGSKTIDSLFKDFEKYCRMSESNLHPSSKQSQNIDAELAIRTSGYYSNRNSMESQALEDVEYHSCFEYSPISTMSRESSSERTCMSSLVNYSQTASEDHSASNSESASSSSEDETNCQLLTACNAAKPGNEIMYVWTALICSVYAHSVSQTVNKS